MPGQISSTDWLPAFEEIDEQVRMICEKLRSDDQRDLLKFLILKVKEGAWDARGGVTGYAMMLSYFEDRAARLGETEGADETGQRGRTSILTLRKALKVYYLESRAQTECQDLIEIVIPTGKPGRYRPTFRDLRPRNRIETPLIEGAMFTYRGNNIEALAYLTSRIRDAVQVEDTTIRWNVSPSHYSTKALEGFVQAIRDSSVRFVSITGPIADHAYVSAIDRAFAGRTDGRVSCYRLYRTAPIMNFVVLTFPRGKKEVLFGYGSQRDDQSGRESDDSAVFSSTDKRLIKEFQRLFNALSSRRFSAPIAVGHPAFASPGTEDCDVYATFPSFPTEHIKGRLSTCRRVSFCGVQWPPLEYLLSELGEALNRNCVVHVALWNPSDPFVRFRSESVLGHPETLRIGIAANKEHIAHLGDHRTLHLHECSGPTSMNILWIDEWIYFAPYWRGYNASTGPHFLVHESSTTGKYLARQFFELVPAARTEATHEAGSSVATGHRTHGLSRNRAR